MKNLSHFYRIIISIFILFSLQFQSYSQVEGLDYQLRYDLIDEEYDCYIIINSGSAISQQSRTQFNAQYSIITPTGGSLSITNNYMPLIDNANYDGIEPIEWSVSHTVISPVVNPSIDLYSIIPRLTPTSRYNDINTGDTIKLFSFIVEGISPCSALRLVDNDIDCSNGCEGGDFSNGFTIGGYNQLYEDNLSSVNIPLISYANIVGSNDICVGDITELVPNSGGYWTSNNNSVAMVDDYGVVTSVGEGTVSFIFQDTIYGCSDDTTSELTVLAITEAYFDGPSAICVGSTTQLSPVSGGVWATNGTAIVTLSDQGLVTAFGEGTAELSFFPSDSSCVAESSLTLTVFPEIIVSITGETEIEIGETTTLSSSSSGTWVSSNNAVATVDNTGVVTGIGEGTTYFIFTSIDGCTIATSNIIVINTTALNNQSAISNNIKVYPNPTSGNIIVNFANANINDVVIAVFNISGIQQAVNTSKASNNEFYIDINGVNPGVYILKIEHDKGVSYKRVFVMK